MVIIYFIPILPVVLLLIALLGAGSSLIRDCLPILSVILILKNIYIDLYCSIRNEFHEPGNAIIQFILGFVRIGVIVPILTEFLTWTGSLLGLIGLVFSIFVIVPIIGLLWLLGEFSSLAYGIGAPDSSPGKAIFGNILSVGCILGIYLFFMQ